ncbi:PKD domain-containing protein [Candidatus Bipolaricaulota bacterium]|nr:PKD domain-containing protein [Candidatus Bipolaricaulota bacterium]
MNSNRRGHLKQGGLLGRQGTKAPRVHTLHVLHGLWLGGFKAKRRLVLGVLFGLLFALWGCSPETGPQSGPVARILAQPTQGQVPLTVAFDGSSSYDPQGEITDFYWDFGDESPVLPGEQVEHTYERSGEFVVTLVVVGPSGTGRGTAIIRVLNNPPIASFSFSPQDPFQDEQVTFDASPSYDPDGEIVSWEWDFGDGGTAEGEVVDHTFTTPGDFTVILTVTDDSGAQATTSRRVTVEECIGGHCGR